MPSMGRFFPGYATALGIKNTTYVEQHTLLHKKEEVKNKWLGLGGVSDVIMGGGERHYLSLQGGYKPRVRQAIPVEALEPPPRRHKDVT